MRRARGPALGCLLAFALSAAAAHAAVDTDAEKRSGAIPPAPTRWVTDQAGFLSAGTRTSLDGRLESYERATGRQVIVWIGRTTGGVPIEDWAARTFAAWGIGRKGQDDGVALFLMAEDRKLRIEVGYGLEGVLPDAYAARIIRDVITPALARGERDRAVTAGVEGILTRLGGGGAAEEPAATPERAPPSVLQIIVFVILGILVLGFIVTHPGLALQLLITLASSSHHRGRGGGFGGGGFGGGGFSGGGGRSGGGGASGSW